MQNEKQPAAKGAALLPLALFLILFVGTGTALTLNGTEMAFYQLSAAVAILPAIAMALGMGKTTKSTSFCVVSAISISSPCV
jgi:Na+/H+ antiporter NhaC